MIKIQNITIKNFRGIKELSIPFQGKSWVIHGRNGSGKSGVVDALEFALSGEIRRLSGEGQKDVNVKSHGPHVDFKDSPRTATVEAKMSLLEMGDFLSISRECSSPSKSKYTPPKGDLVDKYNKYSMGKELVLSRREILKFILSEPGKRSKEVQTLLKINKIDEIRLALQSLENKGKQLVTERKRTFEQSKNRLKKWIEVEELNEESILDLINKNRMTLGLKELLKLDEKIIITSGHRAEKNKKSFANKEELTNEIVYIESYFTSGLEKYNRLSSSFQKGYSSLLNKRGDVRSLSKLNFYKMGLDLIDGGNCPFCETDWGQEELHKIINKRILNISGLKDIQTQLASCAIDIFGILRDIKDALYTLKEKVKRINEIKSAEILKVIAELDSYLEDKPENTDSINRKIIENKNPFSISNFLNLINEISAIKDVITKLPEKTSEEKVRGFLTVCQDRLDIYWEEKRTYLYHVKKSEIAETMLKQFNFVVEDKLNTLYEDVQKDFSRFYQIVNQDDELSFDGDFIAEKGALGFKVNFYDRGKFPPAAYHSEGHQDSMGLCLYLALMKKILGTNFTLAIFDDVLMSIDSDHRKSFCKLLKTEFPDTQFIITTHDEYWKKQMVTEGFISSSNTLNFKNWSIDTGPTVWNEKDSWSEIDEFLEKEDIPRASQTLRRLLEYFMDHMSIRLTARIPRSSSGDHDLSELLSCVTSRYGDLLKKAKVAARSWEDESLESSIKEEKKEFDGCLKKANSEMWAVNGTIHFNSWINMGKGDFQKVKEIYQNLIQHFKCSMCDTPLHVIPLRGASEFLKCDCGKRTYNLKKK